ncbi:hypothetical protein [Flavobacterium tegetincola]|uniref:hypothetical protein n=1 Tax=Flavobacterium tegetincola TaxID=150172 RepID=UPI00047B83EB|nr:hypothetical protein [Flavobacterium tegetincola]
MYNILQGGVKLISLEKVSNYQSIIFWIALVEFLIILFLLYKLKFKTKINRLSEFESKSLNDSKDTKIDMDSLMSSIHNAKPLYKELTKKCHPDRFINNSKQKIAESIFQEISESERDFEKLTLLKIRAIEELNVTF